MLLWFLSLGAIGIWNLYPTPAIFSAFSPHYGINLLVNGTQTAGNGFVLLGSVVLAVTGVEALFADLGRASRIAKRAYRCGLQVILVARRFVSRGCAWCSRACCSPTLDKCALVASVLELTLTLMNQGRSAPSRQIRRIDRVLQRCS